MRSIDDENLAGFIGREVSILQNNTSLRKKKSIVFKGELSYHSSHFQIINGNGRRKNIPHRRGYWSDPVISIEGREHPYVYHPKLSNTRYP